MNVIKPPQPINKTIFLAGSIEMGAAEDWQAKVERELKDCNVTLFNPRRDDFDTSQEQTIDNPYFYGQVTWELDALDAADYILMYLQPETKSPISLLELGLYAQTGKLIVVCPKGFWRSGNVQIVCSRYNIPCYEFLDNALSVLRAHIKLQEK